MKFQISPHSFFFLLLTILYSVPMFITLFCEVNSELPYVSNIILSDFKETRWDLLYIYIYSIISFLTGSFCVSVIFSRVKTRNINQAIIDANDSCRLSIFQYVFLTSALAIGFLLVFKMMLSGTFSSDYMDTFDANFEGYAVQNVFTLLCDVFFFLFIFLAINFAKQYKLLKVSFLVLILITLLRGSRMFSIPLLFYCLYNLIYIKGLTIRRIIYILIGGFISVIGLFSIFFFRHDTSLDDSDVLSLLFLLVQYEVCGIHIPLMNIINYKWHLEFAPMYTIVSDTVLFLVPRIIFPNKNDFLFFDTIQNTYILSPYGGIVGEASVIIYFGILYPLFFLLLGGFLSFMYNLSKQYINLWLKPIYVFTCCSLMFTFLRNGILIAIKNFIIILIVLFLLQILKRFKLAVWR